MTALEIERDPAEVPDATVATASAGAERSSWRRALRAGAIAYVVSRLLVMVGAVVASRRPGTGDVTDALTVWDGQWYLSVVRHGYPADVPAGIDSVGLWPEARVGFFPLYPALVRLADPCVPGGAAVAALAVNVVLGGVVIYLVGLLARAWFGVEVARRSMVLAALVPASAVLSLAYSEAAMIALAAGCLLALHRRQWWLAGVAGALATAARPNGLAVVAACVVAAALAVHERREWRALAAPAFAPLGLLAFHAYLTLRTGEAGVWFRVQRLVWEEHLTFGASTAWDVRHALLGPDRTLDQVLTALTMVVAIALVAAARKVRLPAPAAAYSAAVLVLMVLTSTVTARPRFLYTAFPLLIAFAAWWPLEGRPGARRAWQALVGLSGLGLVLLTAAFGTYDAVP